MSGAAIYVYAIGRDLDPGALSGTETVDGTGEFLSAASGGLSAIYSVVDRDSFSQEEIDRRGSDLEWLGEIGVRHQSTVSSLAAMFTVIPLRAFTLFSSEDALTAFLRQREPELGAVLDRLEGKEEWTLKIEFDPGEWQKAISRRVESLRQMEEEAAKASQGKAYLLRKKLEDEKTRAARQAEEDVLAEIENELRHRLGTPMVVESRQRREGSFPQIDLLLGRHERATLHEVHGELAERYRSDGIGLALTGPWPPYTFAGEAG